MRAELYRPKGCEHMLNQGGLLNFELTDYQNLNEPLDFCIPSASLH